ncbi:MAG: hypothetical protein PHQ32_05510 [Firmicutes bacterium]|nr:hypothetical protein [Bacillota bacterium]
MLNITPTSSSNDDVESLNTLLGVLSKLFARFELVNGKVSTSKPNQIKSYQNNPGMSTMKIKPYGSYISGAVGAVLGAMIGSGLWLLVSFLGFYVAIVGFVMSIISEAGYRLFRGRFGIGMPIIIILSVIFGVFFANTIEIAIRLSQATGISFVNALYYAPQAFYNNQLFLVDKVWLNLGIGLVFALLGSWRIIKKLKSEISYKMDKTKS